ncbi:hypothetical protein GGR88_001562 [Sphingomonas jejuensis]|uniref:TonB C-terminal domain-containing protein n=1 Tax=Sphingomonas jejuensis TaxID=904715 RepID=A0ABX0XLP4_9SPHN|nr:hypothetical protein [Sphingomonas jejuensis]NJC34088.1 hypothetical protein [Sphingomonas jejuensis]
MLSSLLLLIAAPAAATGPVRPPITLAPADIEVAISAPLRAETLRGVTMPDVPRRFRFQCLVDPVAGTLVQCRDLPPDVSPYRTLDAFFGAVRPWDDAAPNWRQVALDRIAGIRLKRGTPLLTTRGPGAISVLVEETISADDVAGPTAASDAVALAATDLVYDKPPTVELIRSFYPQAALRTGTRARVVSRCVVQDDSRLFCRDPHLDPPDQYMTPAERRAFEQASVQLISAFKLRPTAADGSAIAGRAVDLGVSWVLP